MLEKAVRSVLNQSYPHFLVCIYDNDSGDRTSDVAKAFMNEDDRVRYHRHDSNIGAIPNFNFGMKQVKTPYFSLLGDDNTLLPSFFENAISAFSQNPKASVYAGQTLKIDTNGNVTASSLIKWPSGLVEAPSGLFQILENEIPTFESVIFKRGVLDEVGPWVPEFGAATDQDFMMRVGKKCGMKNTPYK